MQSDYRILAQVVELVDTLDSKSNVARRVGSIPTLSTTKASTEMLELFLFPGTTTQILNFIQFDKPEMLFLTPS